MKRRVFSIVLAMVLCFSLVFSIGAATKIKLNSKKVTLVTGQTFKLIISGKKIKKKTFKSTNKKVATVSKKGKITAKATGSCKIKVTVKYGKKKVKKLSCKVTVVAKTVPKKTEQPTKKPVETTKQIELEVPTSIPHATRVPTTTKQQETTQEKPTFNLPDINV